MYTARNISTYSTVDLNKDLLLKEDGDGLLLEDGGGIELEQLTPDFVVSGSRNTSSYSTVTRNT